MTIATAFTGFSLLSPQDWFWDIESYSSTQIVISDGVHKQSFTGLFTFDPAGIVYGTATSSSYFVNNVLVYSVTGMNDNATQLQLFANTFGDTQETYAYVMRAADTVNGSSQSDTLLGYAGNDSLLGNQGNDYLDGGSEADTLVGGDGNDTLIGGSGNDLSVGGPGNNTFFDNDGDDSMVGGTGRDGFILRAGNDTVDGGLQLDSGNGSDTNYVDYFNALAGVNINLSGISGTGGTGSGLAFGDASVGTDVLRNISEVYGSGFNDTITGSAALLFEFFYGGAGDDIINGGPITDTLNYDNGNRVSYFNATGAGVVVDLISGSALAAVGGNSGNDSLTNINQVNGSSFDDTLLGSNRTDVIEVFDGQGGNDAINGRGGFDMVRYANATGGVTVSLALGTASGSGIGSDTIENIEAIRGSNFADMLIGGNPANGTVIDDGLFELFRGHGGSDTIDGGQGYDIADYITSLMPVVIVLNDTLDGSAADGLGGTDVLRRIEAVGGSPFGDSMTGSDSAPFESFEGEAGNDTINGRGGTDRVDYFHARAAVNVRLDLGTASDGYGGVDTLSNVEHVRGSRDFGDVITGDSSANRLEGLGGNDTLAGGAGDDTLKGGAGIDALDGGNNLDIADYSDATGPVTAELWRSSASNDGYGGRDVLLNIEGLIGSAFADLLAGSAGNDSLSGGAGNDGLYAADGQDTLIGGPGNDTLDGGTGQDLADYSAATGPVTAELWRSYALNDGQGGQDALWNIERLIGSAFADLLAGGTGNESFAGGAGNDGIYAAGGNDTLAGGAGRDTLDGGPGFDTADYSAATSAVTAELWRSFALNDGQGSQDALWNIERLVGSPFADLLAGGAGNESFSGGAGNDGIYAAGGNDTLMGGAGVDTLDGGAGIDTADYSSAPNAVTAELWRSFALNDGNGAQDALWNIESLIGSAQGDLLAGGANAESFQGGAGNDGIYAAAGNDTLAGGSGNDTLDGGPGIDTVDYSAASGAVTAELWRSYALNDGQGGQDALWNIESLLGSAFNDLLAGSNGDNLLRGQGGADQIYAAAGNDTLAGGAGNDILNGGPGADVFLFDLVLGVNDLDTVQDFSVADDTIQMAASAYASLGAPGALAVGFLRAGAGFTTAADANDYLIYNSTTGALYYDPDGTGFFAATQFAILGAGLALTAADFVVV